MPIKVFEPDWSEPEREIVAHLRTHPEEQRFDTPEFWAQVYWVAGQPQVAVYRKNETAQPDPLNFLTLGLSKPYLP
jgi:hypothetical protein